MNCVRNILKIEQDIKLNVGNMLSTFFHAEFCPLIHSSEAIRGKKKFLYYPSVSCKCTVKPRTRNHKHLHHTESLNIESGLVRW